MNKDCICVTTDTVEPDMSWERNQYASTRVDYRVHQLRKAGAAEIVEASADAHILVVDQAQICADVINGLNHCRLIIRHGDGFDNLDLNAATRAGIVCINEPGHWSREAAEQAFTIALSLALKIPVQESVARRPVSTGSGWKLQEIMPYQSLATRTVGILGFGKIGSWASRLFGSVVGRVLVCDPGKNDYIIEEGGGLPVDLDELVAQSDILSIHVPATDKTVGLFDRDLLNNMKDGAILINTARGSIVDTSALVEALESGKLSGAGLDSTNPEPLPEDSPLFRHPNVIITPHMGWYSEDALKRMRRSIVRDVLAAAEGIIPKTVVNPEVLDSPSLRFGRS